MNNLNSNLPVYPLPVFILPGGMSRLRIFEQRYLKMIKIAIKNNGFIITSNNKDVQDSVNVNQADYKWGSWVEIVNFEQGNDGVLEIDVKCKSLVELICIEKDADNLHFGFVKVISHWSEDTIGEVNTSLFSILNCVFDQSPLLKRLYKNDMNNHDNWLIARWLEILPVSLELKVILSSESSFQAAKEFVNSIVLLNKKELKQLNQ